MQPVRSIKAAYVGAFLLGALIALLCVGPLRAAELPPVSAPAVAPAR